MGNKKYDFILCAIATCCSEFSKMVIFVFEISWIVVIHQYLRLYKMETLWEQFTNTLLWTYVWHKMMIHPKGAIISSQPFKIVPREFCPLFQFKRKRETTCVTYTSLTKRRYPLPRLNHSRSYSAGYTSCMTLCDFNAIYTAMWTCQFVKVHHTSLICAIHP